MPEQTTEEQIEEFVNRVEEVIGQETAVDTGIDGCIGWLLLYDISIDIRGEAYNADIDFELSEDGIEPLWAEIFVYEDDERRDSLGTVADRIDQDGDTLLYEYQPADGEVDQEVVSTLQDIHSDVFKQ